MALSAAQINQELLFRLSKKIDKVEAGAILKELWLHFWKWPVFNEELEPEVFTQLENAVKRLEMGEPLQHIMEKAWFFGLEWKVNRHVLVPRPETEELVSWILELPGQQTKSVLDLGTGSGCIAVSLTKFGNWQSVSALDVSAEALEIAASNAEKQQVKLDFFHSDVLAEGHLISSTHRWDIMVSNPPYVLKTESQQMEKNVLDFEPHLALFVPDQDPLIFYKRIGKHGLRQLNEKGFLFFEINPKFGKEACQLLENLGYCNIGLRQDMFGKDRMIKAQIP